MENNILGLLLEFLKDDFIYEHMFNDRSEIIHNLVSMCDDYKHSQQEIAQVDNEIKKNFSNYTEIMNLIEARDDAKAYGELIIEKATYLCGVHDGISLGLLNSK